MLAWGAGLCGRVAEAETYRSEAAALVDSLSDEELALRLDAAINLAGAELYLDRFDETGVHAERVVAVARATGQPAVVVFAFMLLAWVRMLRGELAEGGEMLDAAIEEARLLGNAQSLAGLLLNRSLTALAAGDAELAVTRPRRASSSPAVWTTASSRQQPAWRCQPLASRPAIPLGEAVELMLERSGGEEIPLMPGGTSRQVARAPHALFAGAGRRRTPNVRRRAPRHAIRWGRSAWRWRWQNAPAEVALASGDAAMAAERALASAATADHVGVPVEAALSTRSPAARSRKPATANARSPSSSWPRARSMPVAHVATAMQPITSCGCSVAAYIGGRSRAKRRDRRRRADRA